MLYYITCFDTQGATIGITVRGRMYAQQCSNLYIKDSNFTIISTVDNLKFDKTGIYTVYIYITYTYHIHNIQLLRFCSIVLHCKNVKEPHQKADNRQPIRISSTSFTEMAW